jgi:RNA-binding protein 8A
MASAPEPEAVDFEPEDDDLMDEDGGAVDASTALDASASPRAPLHQQQPKLKSAITGGASSSAAAAAAAAAARRTKGRGFRDDHPESVDRSSRLANSNFDSLKSPDGPGPQRCQSLCPPFFLFSFFFSFFNFRVYVFLIYYLTACIG